MGFCALSAENVYRHVLRLDGQSRSLTDRFGWSILMVGDYQEVCREFLLKYCLDLCSRTADRVRFVFFPMSLPRSSNSCPAESTSGTLAIREGRSARCWNGLGCGRDD